MKLLTAIGLAWVLLLVALAMLGAFLSNQAGSDSPPSNAQAGQRATEETARAAPDTAPDDVQRTVARLSKGELGERYKDSRATSNGEAWTIWIRASAGTKAEHPTLLQQEMVRLASLCHPEGMKVAKFSVIYDDDFTDGLGNSSEGKLLQCQMIEGVGGKINWGDRGSDLYALEFSRIFTTEFCHRSYRDGWGAALEK